MQKKYRIAILSGALIFIGISLVFYLNSDPDQQNLAENQSMPTATPSKIPQEQACINAKFKTEQLEMKDGSMKGVIEAGEKYTVVHDWYRCNPVKNGDIVFYRYNTNFSPVPRLVHGRPGDKFKLVVDKKRKAWTMWVNGRLVTNYDAKEPHYFGSETVPPVLSLYEKSMKGVLAPSTYLVFTSVSPGSFDSEAGVVNSEDFMGKVEDKRQVETSAGMEVSNQLNTHSE